MQSFNISSYLGSSVTIGNALGLAVDPQNGDIFLTTLSSAGEPNLFQFRRGGAFVRQSRVAINLLTVPGNPGELKSAVIGKDGHLFICVSKPFNQNVSVSSVAEVSQDGTTVYSSFPDFIYTRGGSGISYNAARQSLLLSSLADKVIYEVNLQGILMDRFETLVSSNDIAYAASSDSVFVLSANYQHSTLGEYKKDATGKYSRVNQYSLQPLNLVNPLAFEINQSNGLFYIQDNNVRVVEFSKSELRQLHEPPGPPYNIKIEGQ